MSANALGSVPRADKRYTRESGFSGAGPERVLACFSLALIKHWPKATRKRFYLTSVFQSHSLTEGDQGKNSSKSRGRSHGGKLHTGLLPRLAQLPFFYSPGTKIQGWHCPQCAGPSHISQQSKQCPQKCCMDLPDGSNSSVETPSSQVCKVGVKLSKTNKKLIMTEGEQQERYQREKERKRIVNEVCMGMHRLACIPYFYTRNEHNSSFTPILSSMS